MKNTKFIPALLLALASFVTLNAQETKPTFQEFLAQFPKAELPCEIDTLKTLPTKLEAKYFLFLFKFQRQELDKDSTLWIQPIACFETEKNVAVLYSTFSGIRELPRTLRMYKKTGEYIGARIEPNNQITNLCIDATGRKQSNDLGFSMILFISAICFILANLGWVTNWT